MLSLTRKADYAVVAMAELARWDSERASAREISESTCLPQPVLTNILHQLLNSGLLNSTMGSKGGYQLARPAHSITLAEMIDAVEGRPRLTSCCADEVEGDEDNCDFEANCVVRDPLRRVNAQFRALLSEISLAQLIDGAKPVPLGLPANRRVPAMGERAVAVAESARKQPGHGAEDSGFDH